MREQDPDLKGLQSFADRRDREVSPIFVGREQETEHVLRHAELLGEDHAQGAHTQGATIVITGCPGSGKSAFLGHFARTFAKLELTNTVLIPIECSHQDLTARNSKDLQAQLAELAIEKKEGLHETFQALLKDAGQALKLRNTFERLEQKISSDAGKRTVVCLLVDEIQNVTEASAPCGTPMRARPGHEAQRAHTSCSAHAGDKPRSARRSGKAVPVFPAKAGMNPAGQCPCRLPLGVAPPARGWTVAGAALRRNRQGGLAQAGMDPADPGGAGRVRVRGEPQRDPDGACRG